MDKEKTKYEVLVEGLSEAVKAELIPNDLYEALVNKAEQEGIDEEKVKSSSQQFIDAFTQDIK